ncbi:esterase-like activity of phytase family protein [Actinomadura vinacea]|uniref:Esterase-like activity of phytase family protein n=1 Tax=Actinomadura vinacea TaxID=115336 RepID=A0ABN3J7D1_9ACTN
MRKTVLAGAIASCAVAALIGTGVGTSSVAGLTGSGERAEAERPTLVGWARLPAETYAAGTEVSGSALGTEPINGVKVPFADQPIQGFSGIVKNADGSFAAISDNGYGRKNNSADFLLRIHRIKPDFKGGTVRVGGGISLTDPKGLVHFPLTRADRKLTGADFDPEAFVRAPDGTYWVGEEFGPYLLHFDRAGRLMEKPIPIPGVKSPSSPDLQPGEEPNIGDSKGLENLAISPDGKTLYPMFEGTVTGDAPQSLRIYEFDRARAAFTGQRWTYQMEAPKLAVADLVSIGRNRFLTIERDNLKGDAAAFKKVYKVDLADGNQDGRVDKTEAVDLLNIANPDELGTPGKTFKFPFFTIEAVTVLNDRTIGVLNDNNFPSDATRVANRADDNEFISVRLPESLSKP